MNVRRSMRVRWFRYTMLTASITIVGVGCSSIVSTDTSSTSSDKADESVKPAEVTDALTTDAATAVDERKSLCTLVTLADVEKAIGESAAVVTDSRDECWYENKSSQKVVNMRRKDEDPLEWRAAFVGNDQWVSINVGEEAYAGKALASIEFRSKDVQYEVNVIYSTKGDPKQVVGSLTKLLAAKV